MLEVSINALKSLAIEPNANTFNNLGNVFKDQNNTNSDRGIQKSNNVKTNLLLLITILVVYTQNKISLIKQ